MTRADGLGCHEQLLLLMIDVCCAGRISVFAEASAETRAQGNKGGEWIYVTHQQADPQVLVKSLHDYSSHTPSHAGT